MAQYLRAVSGLFLEFPSCFLSDVRRNAETNGTATSVSPVAFTDVYGHAIENNERMKLTLLQHTGTAIKHPPVSHRVKPSFVIFDIRALWRSALSAKVPGLTRSGTGCFIAAVPVAAPYTNSGRRRVKRASLSWFVYIFLRNLRGLIGRVVRR